jgi:hypothetical protein
MPVSTGLFVDAAVGVREDAATTCAERWYGIGRPGAWWSGPERVAMAAEVRSARRCETCAERKASLSVSPEPAHEANDLLSSALVDGLHRISTDPGRLTERWLRALLGSGITEAAFVESVGVMATTVAVDTLARGIGVPPPPLPEPEPGEPTCVTAASAEVHSAWVPTVVPEKAEGVTADYYARCSGYALGVPHILRALSLVPDEHVGFGALMDVLYVAHEEMMDFTRGRAIVRPAIELLASTVSAANDCFY